jgi:5-(carboxyamino)imidazole ribonucleotide synthase
MINLIGQIPPPEGILALEGAHLHLYDKAPRPGRKVGHVNLCAEDFAALRGRLPRATAAIRDPELGRILEAFERVHEQRAVR